MKTLVKRSVISIGMAMAIFCLVGIIFDIRNGGSYSFENYCYTKMVAGCVAVGLGFGVPSVVYSKESLPMAVRVVIHMGIGLIVYTVVAFVVGWMGNSTTVGQKIAIVAVQIGVAFLIWFLFMQHNRWEAKRLNEKIREKNEQVQ